MTIEIKRRSLLGIGLGALTVPVIGSLAAPGNRFLGAYSLRRWAVSAHDRRHAQGMGANV